MAFRNNFGNPQGFIGRLMLSGMNMGHSPMAKWAFTQFDVPDDGMLVDIGCGGGFNIRRLLDRSKDGFVYGIDISSTSVEKSKKTNKKNIGKRCEVLLGSAENLPLKDNSIKLATAFETVYFWKDLETTLSNLKTDYLDLYQFHNPDFCPKPGDGSGMYECMCQAKEQGKIRHIGITNHRLLVALEAVESGLYETLQFPFSYLASREEIELVEKCQKAGMGFIAMKGLSGGLINNSAAAYAFMAQFEHVLPIWGIQRETELEEFLSYIEAPPAMTPEISAVIEKDREQLQGDFCRGCGYCMPCPAGIEINACARMSLMIRRAPSEAQLTKEMQEKMMQIEHCLHCGRCISKCPYHLNTPELLQKNLKDYKEILAGKPI